ncbi:hypothetical protein ACFX2A_003705 [Malus domestica]
MRGLGLGPRKLRWHSLGRGLGTVSLGWHDSGRGESSMDLATNGYRSSHRGGSHGGRGEGTMDLAVGGYLAVVPMVETRGGDAAPIIVVFCLTDLHNPISCILEFSLMEFSKFLAIIFCL